MYKKMPIIKLSLLLLFWIVTAALCCGQKYEVWLEANGVHYENRLNLKSFDDSILTVVQKPSIFNLYNPQDINYKWETVYGLKIRNQTRHNTGLIIGTGVGIIAAILVGNSMMEKNKDNPLASIIVASPIAVSACAAGLLAGHLITSAKIVIPLGDKDAKGKSEALRGKIRK